MKDRIKTRVQTAFLVCGIVAALVEMVGGFRVPWWCQRTHMAAAGGDG